jgi:TolB-like protein/Flp pilus assembly protein TadD
MRHLTPGLALAMLAIATIVGVVLWTGSPKGSKYKPIQSLAVLPFENLSGDAGQDYLAEALTEALIIDLSKLGTVNVIPRSGVKGFKHNSVSQSARQLQVDAFVEGSVLRSADRVRVTAQLVNPANQRNLWAESYDRGAQDILTLQREITQAIAGEIGARLGGSPRAHPVSRAAVIPEAYDFYLRGKSLATRRVRAENREAIRLLEQAVAKDPQYAPAHAALALAYIEWFFTFAPEDQQSLLPKSRALIDRAISLDPNSSEAYLARGRLLWSPVNGFAYAQAIQDLRRAVSLNPKSVQAHWWLGAVYGHIGLLEEGFREAKLATELNPLGALPPNHLVEPLLWQGKWEQALQFLLSVPKEADDSLNGSKIAWARFRQGKTTEALGVVERYLTNSAEDMGGQLRGLHALFLAANGKESEAENEIRTAVHKQGTGQFHHTAYFIACAYARLRQPDRVVSWLQHAAEKGFPCYPLFKQDPSLDSVRRQPRFIEFMDKMKKQWEEQKRRL